LRAVQRTVIDGYHARRTDGQLSNPCRRKLPIGAMTANEMKGEKEMCLDAGMDDDIS